MEDSVGMRPVSWYDDVPQTSKSQKVCLKNLNPIPHWGGGGGQIPPALRLPSL